MASGENMLMDGMIYLGSILMVYNIVRYRGFIRKMSWMRDGGRNSVALFVPVVFMGLFLAGYLVVGVLGHPDWVIAGILLGGSIFVLIILQIMFFIVQRVEDHEKLQHELREARMASEAKTIFLSNMSHDIRTPLNAILGYAQIAERDTVNDAERRGYISKIRSAGQHLLALINDVLEMSRIESGKIELEEERTNLCDVFGEMREMFASQMEQKGITFTVEPRDMTDHIVMCDRTRLNRMLLNLVSNAYKFTPEGGTVSVTMRQVNKAPRDNQIDQVAQSAQTTGTAQEIQNAQKIQSVEAAQTVSGQHNTRIAGYGHYELCVKDTGIGMSPEFAEKVFDMFERERTSTVSGIQGTGLGMAITKSIVESMGGTIEVDSHPGEGTEFLVKLTFAIPADAESKALGECARTPEKVIDFSGKRVLLAEDNPVNREIAVMILTESDLAVETVENGKAAVEKLASSEPGYFDAVLMDIQMPEMDGYEAARRIRALKDPALARIPIIAMTANAFREDIENEKKAGMTAHISKPLDVPEVIAVLADTLGGR